MYATNIILHLVNYAISFIPFCCALGVFFQIPFRYVHKLTATFWS